LGAQFKGSGRTKGNASAAAFGAVDKSAQRNFPARLDGVWCWFADPRALYYGGNVYAGAVSMNGSILVVRWPDGGGMDQSFVLHHKLEQDDHDNPALLVRDSDQKLLCFYSEHVGSEMYLRISTNAEDVSAWGAETGLHASLGATSYTYPNPVQLTGEENDPIYLFYRDTLAPGNQRIAFSKSTDDGATWAAQTQLIVGTYAKYALNGDARIDMVIGNNPSAELDHGIYHLYYQGGNYYKSDGTQIVAEAPFAVGDLTQVYDGSVTPGWLWDIAIDGSGYPVIVYATFADVGDPVYCYARWNGSSWTSHNVVSAGATIYEGVPDPQDYYCGGIVLDHSDVNVVYLSKAVGGVHWLYRYETANGGSSWTAEVVATGGDVNHKQIRPVVIRDHVSDVVLWLAGRYINYTSYKMNVVCR